MSEELSRALVLEKIAELAFGKCNDAAKLAFMNAGDIEKIAGLDLSNLAGLHVGASGGVELRLVDRVKLAEILLEALEKDENDVGEKESLIDAINGAAARLKATDGAVEQDEDS